MPEFLTTTACSYHIEQLILTAKTQIHLLCPYLKLSKTLFERLADANERGIKIKIVYGKTELNPAEKQKLFSLENVEMYYFENLHAKCYFSNDTMIITSMNLYEFSEKNNREMGILLSQRFDTTTFTNATNEAISIIKNAIKQTQHATEPLKHYTHQK